MTITFTQMGFVPEVTAASVTPATDGYFGTFNGLPYGIHPEVTPDAYAALVAAITDGTVTVTAYAAPIVALAQAQATQTESLSAACGAAIVAGFTSSALGYACNYPSSLKDQANQNTAANCSTGGLLWCETGSTWAFVAHTQAQAQAVVTSFAPWLNSCQAQLVTLTGSVNAATTVAEVQGIAWANP